MAELRTFDPVGAFQGARRNQQLISAEESAAPRRNQLSDLNIQQGQQNLATGAANQQRSATSFDQKQALQRATILGQSAQALGGLPLEQRDAAFASISPQLQEFGIDPTQFPPGSFTDENLQRAISESQAFIGSGGDVDTLTTAQKDRAALTKGFSEADELKTRRIDAGLEQRAVGSAAQTIAAAGSEDVVGASQAVIAERVEFGKKTGASRSKAIDTGFERIGKITTNINNLDRAIKAVEAGAGTGAIEKRFPSIKAAAVELDQIQGELALDVIGAVTFGALSEGELNLAKQIALPTGLDGPQLIQHLTDRKAAQAKLLNYFQDQVDFLDQGGSVAGFLRQKQRGAQAPEQQAAAQPQGAVQVGRFTVEAE